MITLYMSQKNDPVIIPDGAFSTEAGILTLEISLGSYSLTGKTITAVFSQTAVETATLIVSNSLIQLPITLGLLVAGENQIQLNIREGLTLEQSPIMKWIVGLAVAGTDPAPTDVDIITELIAQIPLMPAIVVALEERIDAIITTPAEGVTAQEIIDARNGEATLGGRINGIDAQLADGASNIHSYSNLAVGNDWTAAIQMAVNDTDVKQLYFPVGTYESSTIRIYRDNLEIFGQGESTIIKYKTETGDSLRPDVANVYAVFAFLGTALTTIKNIKIHDMKVLGLVETLGFTEQNHLWYFAGIDGLDIYRCNISGFQGDGINIAMLNETEVVHNYNIRISDNTIDGLNSQNRNGITISDGTGVLINSNIFDNCSKYGMPGHIDIEGELPSSIFNGITVSNNIFKNSEADSNNCNIGIGLAQNFTTQPKGISIIGNIFLGSNRNGVGIGEYVGEGSSFAIKDIIIANNFYDGLRFIRADAGIIGASITGNMIKQTAASIMGMWQLGDPAYAIKQRNQKVTISNNTFEMTNLDWCLGIGFGQDILITNNRFENFKDICIVLGSWDVTASITKIRILNNIFNGLASETTVLCPGGALTGAINNRYSGNGGISYITNFWTYSGSSAARPVLTSYTDIDIIGLKYYDTTLGIPIWWNGTNWVDATGTTV